MTDRLYKNKWLFRAVLILGISAGIFAEGSWLLGVKYGFTQPIIAQWLRRSDAIKNVVGDVASVEIKRIRSTYSFSFHHDSDGRFHYFVEGKKGALDVLVAWHQNPANQAIVIDKLEDYDNSKTLWVKGDQ